MVATWVIRPARLDDAEQIAGLCRQLGYPTSVEQAQHRLQQLLGDADHAIYVAEGPQGQIGGWIHAYVRRLLVADPHAALGGLVADAGNRRSGVGRLLLEQVEAWARERGCATVRVNSNVIRDDARAFYEAQGYAMIKTQRAFRKALS